MKTLRELASSAGYTGAPISMRGVARALNMGGPVSLRSLFYPYPSREAPSNRDLRIGKVTCSQIWLKIANDGNWQFHVHLHSDAVLIGDRYAVGFVFAGDGHGAIIEGHLSAGDDDDRTIGGNDPWIRKHWQKIARSAVVFRAHGAGDETDPARVLNFLIKVLEESGKYIPLLL